MFYRSFVINKTNDLQISILYQTLLDYTILKENLIITRKKFPKILGDFFSYALKCCFCFTAKPSEKCPMCAHLKVGGVCQESNIGKSTGSRSLSFKFESQRL